MSQVEWYYAKDGVQAGPLPVGQLREMARTGALRPDDLVWTEGMPEWRPAAAVQAVYSAAAGVVPYGGAGATPSGGLNYYNPAYEPVYAGFWLRFCATFVDTIIIAVPLLGIGALLFFGLGLQNEFNKPGSAAPELLDIGWRLLYLLVGWLYYASQESGPHMATLGKRACGIVVTDMEGQRLTFGRASGRFFGKLLSDLTCSMGYVLAAFTPKRQALHDLVASTLVVRKTH